MVTIGQFARLGEVSPRMLRNYDQIGLLRPEHVDAATGYRSYGVAQLTQLHRLMALRDLGLSLEQIRSVLTEQPDPGQLRGMLRLRRTQIEAAMAEDEARLLRVSAHLDALERNAIMHTDVIIKHTMPLRIAEATGTAPGVGPENLGPVFARLLPEVLDHLRQQNAHPAMSVAHYEEPEDDGRIVLHAGFDIGAQTVHDGDRVSVVDLPVVEVASLIHSGSMATIKNSYEDLVRWIETAGLRIAAPSRELYHEWSEENPEANVTELQFPVAH